MEIHHSAAVALCGPHRYDDRDSLQFHRVDEAIRSMYWTPHWSDVLIICGDARRGKDVYRLGEYASRIVHESNQIGEATTPKRVVPLYDSGASTLSDVRLVLRWVNATTEPGSRTRLRLFTDDWHMPRASAMCEREAAMILTHDRSVIVTPHPVESAHAPPVTDEQLRRERKGLDDYYSGLYVPNTGLGWGKPPVDS